MEMQAIPLSALKPSPKNARKTASKTIAELAASIAAHGLIQSLAVEKVNGHFEVVAGNRRLEALQLLLKSKRLPDALKTGVPCRVVDAADAAEVSLAENAMREAMHPADQFEAFRAVLDQGASTIEDVAARFSVPPLFVRQRMKLANVAPEILKAYRAGKLDLKAVEAFALSDDHAEQLRILKAGVTYEWNIRDALSKNAIALTDRRITAIGGVEAYEKAGGAVRRDLFDNRNAGYALDVKLVEKLLAEQFKSREDKLTKEGWSFIDIGVGISEYDYPKVAGKAKDIDKAKAGAIVLLDRSGNIQVVRGVLRPGSRVAKDGSVTGGKAKSKKPGEISFAAVQRLQAEANGIVQVEVADNDRLAIALLVADLAFGAFRTSTDAGRKWVHYSRDHSGRVHGPAMQLASESPAAQAMEAVEEMWTKKLPKSRTALREWALAQELGELTKLLAFLVAREIEVVDFASDSRKDSGVTELAKAAGVDLSDHWKPTEDWLATLPKAAIVAMVREAAGKESAAKVEKLAKKQIPAIALPMFPAGWLPKPLRPKAAKPAKSPATKKVRAEEEE